MMPASGDFPGGRMAVETPLHVSDVALVDPKDGSVAYDSLCVGTPANDLARSH